MKKFKNQKLTKEQLRYLKGGACIAGDYFFYFPSGLGNTCAVPGDAGEACFGTVVGGKCRIA